MVLTLMQALLDALEPGHPDLALAREIAGRSPDAVRAAKRLFHDLANGGAVRSLLDLPNTPLALIRLGFGREPLPTPRRPLHDVLRAA